MTDIPTFPNNAPVGRHMTLPSGETVFAGHDPSDPSAFQIGVRAPDASWQMIRMSRAALSAVTFLSLRDHDLDPGAFPGPDVTADLINRAAAATQDAPEIRWSVNVRAIVEVTFNEPEAGAVPVRGSLWELYGTDKAGKDSATLRMDTPIEVTAPTAEEAITKAKIAAESIIIEIDGGSVDSVQIWVDPGIDVTNLDEEAHSSRPSS